MHRAPNRVLKNVSSDGRTRREREKKRSLHIVNEYFEHLSNTVMPSAVVFQHPAKVLRKRLCQAFQRILEIIH